MQKHQAGEKTKKQKASFNKEAALMQKQKWHTTRTKEAGTAQSET